MNKLRTMIRSLSVLMNEGKTEMAQNKSSKLQHFEVNLVVNCRTPYYYFVNETLESINIVFYYFGLIRMTIIRVFHTKLKKFVKSLFDF